MAEVCALLTAHLVGNKELLKVIHELFIDRQQAHLMLTPRATRLEVSQGHL